MWPKTFGQRLEAWHHLRQSVATVPVDSALQVIDQWWKLAPWRPYYLHWDDREVWPDPWQLLSDDIYCHVAKGLGILYTISMLDRQDITDARLVLTDSGHNLVLVQKEKYILNWDGDTIVNNNLTTKINKQYQQSQVVEQYK